jgi:hypothetical protein
MIVDWFAEIFNTICNAVVSIGEHPVLAGALALGTGIIAVTAKLTRRGR